MLLLNIILYIFSFIIIWLGSGLIVSSVDRFSRRLRLSSFAVSFILLGLLTSTPEFAVGLQAIADHDPEIFVGNLLGGIPVIFLFVIPALAILGNGINIKHELDKSNLIATLAVVFAPSLLVLDKKFSNPEGAVLIILYLVLILLIERKHGLLDKDNSEVLNIKAYSSKDVLKILFGIGLIFISSNIIVEKTMYFANLFSISAFYISLIVVSLGTNLPEFSLAIRSVFTRKKDVAMGDYMGSAAANTFLFGVFTLLNDGEVLTVNNFFITYLFISLALCLFYLFSASKNNISRNEGFILLGIYLIFAFLEFIGIH